MTHPPTLLEDLGMLAEFYEGLIAGGSDTVKVTIKADAARLPGRLRAHAARLREEMARANKRWTESTSTVVRSVLERVNAGPVTPGEPR